MPFQSPVRVKRRRTPPKPDSALRISASEMPRSCATAIAVAHDLGISDALIRKALSGFGGVRRRFTRTGDWNGITVIDDYGPHPVDIEAVLRAARESTTGQVIAVVQPHRYTRLQTLFTLFCTCFND